MLNQKNSGNKNNNNNFQNFPFPLSFSLSISIYRKLCLFVCLWWKLTREIKLQCSKCFSFAFSLSMLTLNFYHHIVRFWLPNLFINDDNPISRDRPAWSGITYSLSPFSPSSLETRECANIALPLSISVGLSVSGFWNMLQYVMRYIFLDGNYIQC